ncbi:MAG: hypothetical protein KKD38_02820 [Candidatus Delongbacteria bacterium]|nr:hypothetical protein [Candidatus Delongbacteria bacterium]
MNEIELIINLIESAKKISYTNKDEFDILKKRVEMVVRKLFGEQSHYLTDFSNIHYSPRVWGSGYDPDWGSYFNEGMKQFRNLLQVMLEDKRFSTNYQNENTVSHIKSEKEKHLMTKNLREVVVLIASPSDVKLERDLLMDKLETKFRRENFEEQCNARLIINGWESLASQTGYAQDIINNDLVKKTNIVLAVFRHKLGSPTTDPKTGVERSPSGSAEELLFAIRNEKVKNPPLGMVYFYGNAPVISLDSIDKERIENEWLRLKEFKEAISKEILYKSYNIEEEILDIVCFDLCENIKKYFNDE